MDNPLDLLPSGAGSTAAVAALGLGAVLLIYLVVRSAVSLAVKLAASLAVLAAGGGIGTQMLSRIDFSQVGAGVGAVVTAIAGGWLVMQIVDDL